MSKVRLGDIVSRIRDNVDRHNTDLIYYVGGEHFDSNALKITKKGLIKGSTIGPAFSTRFKPGDVLLMSRNPHLRKAGIVDFEGICSDVSYIIRTNDEKIIRQDFIPILFQSDIFWNFAERNKKGSTNFFLNWSDFERFEFELPPVKVQEDLTKVLWSIDDTVTSYNDLVVQNEQIIMAKFVEMFGNVGYNEKNFKFKKLGECSVVNPRKPRDIDDDLNISFVPMASVSDSGEMETSEIRKYGEVKKGYTYFAEDDILFAKITPSMENGKGAIATNLANGIGMGSTEFHVLRPIENISNPTWLYVLTKSQSFRREAERNMAGTGGQLRVPTSFLKNFKVALPPIELQKEFESFVNKVVESKIHLIKGIEYLNILYQKIVGRYLSIKEG